MTASCQLRDRFATATMDIVRPMIPRPLLFPATQIGVALLFACRCVIAAPLDPVTWTEIREILVQTNIELKSARQQIEASRFDLERAGLRPNPTLSMSTSSWRYNQSPVGRAGDLVAHLDQSIERGGKRQLRQAQGLAALQAAQYDLLRSERQVLTRMAAAIIDLDSARLRRTAAQEIAAALDRSEAIAKRRLKAGDLSEVSVGRVSADAIRARNDVTVAQGDIHEALQNLRVLIGPEAIDKLEPQRLDIESLPVPARTVTGEGAIPVPALADAGAPDLAASQRRELAAQAALDLAKAQRTRDVTVGVQIERTPFSNTSVFGLSMSVPLFVFNDYSADIGRANSDVVSAQLDTRRLELQLQADRLRLSQGLINAREREARLRDQALPVAVRNAETAEFAFQRGAASVLDVLDAQRTLRSVQIEVLNARADRLRAATSVALLEDPRLRVNPDDIGATESLPR